MAGKAIATSWANTPGNQQAANMHLWMGNINLKKKSFFFVICLLFIISLSHYYNQRFGSKCSQVFPHVMQWWNAAMNYGSFWLTYIPYIPPISLLFCFRLTEQSSDSELLFMVTGSSDEHDDVVAGWWLSANKTYSTYLCFCIFGFLAFTFLYFLVSLMSQVVGGWVVDKQKIIDLTNQPGGAPFNGTWRSQLVKWSK